MKNTMKTMLCVLAFSLSGQAGTKLLRFPAISGDKVCFTYAGDLWLASVEGGTATRLTSHDGLELFPRFSPDGKTVAFTAQIDGDEQVYTVPTLGGVPTQLTFFPARGPLPDRWGYDNQVYGWTPDGQSVLFRSLRESFDLSNSRLYTVPKDGGIPQALPMPVAGAGAFSPDGTKVVYSPLFRDFRTWKRYQGGWAQELMVFDLQSRSATPIAEHPRADRDPMWFGDSIYFNSDRDGHYNLYAYDPISANLSQLTHEDQWDVRWPSSDGSARIVFERAGELYVYNTQSGASTKIEIRVPDDGTSSRPEQINVADQIEGWALSPNAKRALFVARGDLFTAPVEHGVTRNLTQSSNAHEREASWSPDGAHIAYVSDISGEEQIYVLSHQGGESRQLTTDLKTRLYGLTWSPDSKSLAYTNKDGEIFVMDVAKAASTKVADEGYGYTTDYAWSPDSAYLAYAINDENTRASIYIWSRGDGQSHRVTDGYFDESNPVWDPSGDLIYYLSTREFVPQIGSIEWNYVVDRERGIYAVALRSDVDNPFAPRNDDEGKDKADKPDKEGKDGKAKKGKKDSKAKGEDGDETDEVKPVRMEFDGLAERVVRVPVESDNYFGLVAIDGQLVYGKGGPFYYGRSSDVSPTLFRYDIKERKETEVASDVRGYDLSADGKSVLIQSAGGFSLRDLSGGEPKQVSTSHLSMWRIPKQEWATIFDEVWRRFRDHFYVANMHGYDWDAIGQRYRELLPYVSHRTDLNYIMGEMVSELSVSHAYISGGDMQSPARPQSALLGAELEFDADASRYRIGRIFAGQNEEPRYRSPLTQVGVDIDTGDYLLAINQHELKGDVNPYALLRYAGSQNLELTVADDAKGSNRRTLVVDPINSETSLRYLDWVNHNRDYVTEKTDGRVGYLHIPDMGPSGIYEFIKWYYGQIRKDGLVVDVRGNGGGNVSQMIINRLARKLYGVDFARTQDYVSTYPNVVFHGPMVCLLNETSASDGDIFPWTFRQAGLGPLIGKRSWGGIIGITNHGPLLDGGSVNVPEFGNASAAGEWVVEGHGVDPDIQVENDPVSVLNGQDPQLDRGIEEVLKLMEEKGMSLPTRPEPPVKAPSNMQ